MQKQILLLGHVSPVNFDMYAGRHVNGESVPTRYASSTACALCWSAITRPISVHIASQCPYPSYAALARNLEPKTPI
jgi:hypothetical protein